MTLKEKLLAHMKEALRSKDSIRLNTIRSLISATKNQEIDLRRELQDEEVLSLITREVKKRKEASSLYKQGGRTDLMEKEDQEQLILQAYLPEQVSEEVLRKRIQEVIDKQADIAKNKINLLNLQKSKIINKKYKKLKLLGPCDLKQKLNIEVNAISKSAREKIEKLSGKVKFY